MRRTQAKIDSWVGAHGIEFDMQRISRREALRPRAKSLSKIAQGELYFDAAYSSGNLTITIWKATGLAAMDRGGTSDPYVVIKVGKNKVKTTVRAKTLSPVWDEKFSFSTPRPTFLCFGAVDEGSLEAIWVAL